jgi:hypothetical protein
VVYWVRFSEEEVVLREMGVPEGIRPASEVHRRPNSSV